MTDTSSPTESRRRTLRVTGQVQGVGFRPFVYRLARSLGLVGTVRNDPLGVTVVAQGPVNRLDALEARIQSDAPDLAVVESVTREAEHAADTSSSGFAIVESDHEGTVRGRVTVDAATCAECLAEMRDPGDRRHGHALLNCTNCGPRYTIVRDLPYDRPLTTMASFPMCRACEAEYGDPGDRRFHAQPTCCPRCGPRLLLVAADGTEHMGNPIRGAAALLVQGGILAMKGLGGYHLVVDATEEDAVRRLRAAKHRDHKPFAIMVRDEQAASELVALEEDGRAALLSPARPIVLARRLPETGVAPSVAPRMHRLGLMLPSTPLQHLLFDEGFSALVMTSANHSDDPLLTDDEEARRRLGDICDAFLVHDRAIQRAVDDSVVLDTPRGVVPLRRARGYVPAPLVLPTPAPTAGLCVGGDLKNTVAVVREGRVVLGQHLGDLSYTLAHQRFERTIEDLERLFEIRPAWVACDAHPDYLSRRYAVQRAETLGVPLLDVQHHHAHVASLLAEHGRRGPVVGVACDGVGYGADGTAWGGEILVADLVQCQRAGRMRPLLLPGGDAAARETGRPALAWLHDLLGDAAGTHPASARAMPDAARRRTVASMLRTGLKCTPSSGTGRLFDAMAAILGLCSWNHHEAESGMLLEAEASRSTKRPSGDGLLSATTRDGLLELDTRPLLAALLEDLERRAPAADIAWRFHDAIADGLARAALHVSLQVGVATVGLTGGVFGNALLTDRVATRLLDRGVDLLLHRSVPPGDGGLAYGQAAVAAATLAAPFENDV